MVTCMYVTKYIDQPTYISVPACGETAWHEAHILHIHICVMQKISFFLSMLVVSVLSSFSIIPGIHVRIKKYHI